MSRRLTKDEADRLRAEYTVARNRIKRTENSAKREFLNVLIGILDVILKQYDRDEMHDQFWNKAAEFVRVHG